MACSHIDVIARLSPPKLVHAVHREECTQCFDSQDLPLGIEVCLECFNGGCSEPVKHHAQTHIARSGHKYTLNVKRKPKPSPQRAEEEEPPAKMTKLAIQEDREEDRYEKITTVKCWACDAEKGRELPDAVKAIVDGVIESMSSARQSEVKAWEEEILPCEHTLTLHQESTGPIPASGLAKCASCDLKENLWLCLTCGNLGCGRKQFGGVDGNSHSLAHYQNSLHPFSVKLGTITPEGGADVYCYACDDAKLDPEMAAHLSSFGINVQTLSKTEKTMTELQIEHNLQYDFSMTSEDGKALEPLCGPGLTGLANLGNSCYIASTLQALFSLPSFQARYNPSPPSTTIEHAASCPEPLPASCIECQLRKVSDGLLSGRYAVPRNQHFAGSPPSETSSGAGETPKEFQAGIKPSGLKALVGKGHAEFGTMKQQDAEEFFGFLIDYSKFKSFPEVLVVHAKKFQLVNWVPTKLDVPLILPPANTLELGEVHLGHGIQPGEAALPEDAAAAPSLPEFDAGAMQQLEGMGFPPIRAQKALLATGNSDAQAAMEWLFEHMDDPGNQGAPEPPAEQIQLVQDMGFTEAQARKALRVTNGDMERAVDWLFSHPDDMGEEPGSSTAPAASSTTKEVPGTTDVPVRYRLKAFVSHKGPSVHSGHYVAHVRVGQGEEWVLFNDEKVVKADEESVKELKGLAYLYFFERA
ncbi:hypothetical protein H0H93_005126 [Arthromyces matolae]|nr:hypothetical protein H0H93_005126 [Arthromyces matolae]